MVADWLAGTLLDYQAVSQGVNVQLAQVPRDAGDAQPPNITAVRDYTRDGELARGRVPTRDVVFPILLVTLPEPFRLEGEVTRASRQDTEALTLAIVYAAQDAASDEAAEDAAYTLRAIIWSLWQLHKNENADARQRNGIAILACQEIAPSPVAAETEDAIEHLVAAVLVRYRVRETMVGG